MKPDKQPEQPAVFTCLKFWMVLPLVCMNVYAGSMQEVVDGTTAATPQVQHQERTSVYPGSMPVIPKIYKMRTSKVSLDAELAHARTALDSFWDQQLRDAKTGYRIEMVNTITRPVTQPSHSGKSDPYLRSAVLPVFMCRACPTCKYQPIKWLKQTPDKAVAGPNI